MKKDFIDQFNLISKQTLQSKFKNKEKTPKKEKKQFSRKPLFNPSILSKDRFSNSSFSDLELNDILNFKNKDYQDDERPLNVHNSPKHQSTKNQRKMTPIKISKIKTPQKVNKKHTKVTSKIINNERQENINLEKEFQNYTNFSLIKKPTNESNRKQENQRVKFEMKIPAFENSCELIVEESEYGFGDFEGYHDDSILRLVSKYQKPIENMLHQDLENEKSSFDFDE